MQSACFASLDKNTIAQFGSDQKMSVKKVSLLFHLEGTLLSAFFDTSIVVRIMGIFKEFSNTDTISNTGKKGRQRQRLTRHESYFSFH